LILYGGAGKPLQPPRSGATARRASPGVGGGVPVPRPGPAAGGRSPDTRHTLRSAVAALLFACSPAAAACHDHAHQRCSRFAI